MYYIYNIRAIPTYRVYRLYDIADQAVVKLGVGAKERKEGIV